MTQFTNPVALSTSGFADLGAGPLQIGAYGPGIIVVVADTQPGAGTPGELLNGNDATPHVYNTTSHVWARAITSALTVEVTSGLVAAQGGGPATMADGANVAQGTTTDAAWSGSGAGTLVGLLKAVVGGCASLVSTGLGKAARVVLVDPTTGNGSLVQAFHNSDNQAIGATSYGLFTGGVDQLINAAGNLDRKRAVTGDAMMATGLAAEAPMLWNGTSYDRARGTGGATNVVSANPPTLGVGQQTTTTTAAALPAQALVNGVSVIALPTNAGTVFLGGSGLTTGNGYPLAPGQGAPGIAVQNMSAIYILGTNATDRVAYLGN